MASPLTADFFRVQSLHHADGLVDAVLELNAAHAIFTGHFPGQPVVPGACLLQMVKEIMQTVTGKNLRLSIAHHLKFIAPVDPRKNPVIGLHVKYAGTGTEELNVVASFSYAAITCCKFNGVFGFCE